MKTTLDTVRALALAALAAAFPLLATAAGGDSPPRLFGPTLVVPARAQDAADAATRVRERAVRPDFAAVEALARAHLAPRQPARFVLDLFDGLDLEAEVIHAEVRATGATVFAKLIDVELGSAVLTYEQGVLVASVAFPGGNYSIDRGADGTYRVAQRALQFAPQELPPRQRFAAAATPDLFEPDVPFDSGRLIDVMIVWTPLAQTAAGGAASIAAVAQNSIDHSNLTYLNSGVAQRLRLVHAQQIAYTETTACGATAFDCALDDATDGNITGLHALRDTHGADLVALLISNSAFCGLAWLPFPSAGTAHLAYSVTDQGCAVGNKSFVHELGHNMGAHHDPYVAPGPGAYAYSHGIVNLTQRWRTVLAYNNQCSASGFNCTRIDFLSNPKLTYNGAGLGDASARNNAHTLNKTAKAVAAYRPTSALHPLPARFSDVSGAHPSFGYIEFLAQAGVTSGCTASAYCPDASVTRRQMAVFLERTMRASNWTPPAATGLFSDVPPGSQFRDYIEALRNDGITTGCTATTYCPDSNVTRGEMAVFLLRARCGAAYVPNLPAAASFQDVPTTHGFYRYIEKLYAIGITGGCATAPLRYCPDAPVTRAQMATFIERTFPLLTPTEVCAP